MRPKFQKRFTPLMGAVLLGFVVVATPAEAQYLDPGAGSVIVQAVIAVVVGLAATLKLYWGRISGFLARRSKKDTGR